MTSTPVTELQSIVTNVTKTNTAGNRGNAFADSFSQVMGRAGGNNEAAGQRASLTDRKVSDGRKESIVSAVSKDQPAAVSKEPADKVQSAQGGQPEEKVTAEMEQAVTEAAEKVVEAVAKELNVSEEDIIKAMEALGMTLFDLLNPDNMTQLVLQLSGETDMLSLLTNEDLYNSVQNLMNTVNEEMNALQDTLFMDEAQMEQLVDELTGSMQNAQTPEVTETADKTPVIEITQETEAEAEVADVNVSDTVKQDVSKETEMQPEVQSEVQTEAEVKAAAVEGSSRQPADQSNAKEEHAQSGHTAAVQQPFNPNEVQTAPVEGQTFMPFASQETRQIMNQIMDYMKIHVTPELSEMELQLHPESLGNVRIQLAAKDGVVTAQFKAESELVKAAIESQMLQLKDSLNEKGVKVEAVEVTVESHAFERNLEQGNESSSNSEEPKKKSARRINLNMVDSAGDVPVEEMEAADRIAAEMMAHAGNTVDFTA